eukprot:1161670-Pelagomonas_calceolata.AAC.29
MAPVPCKLGQKQHPCANASEFTTPHNQHSSYGTETTPPSALGSHVHATSMGVDSQASPKPNKTLSLTNS